LPVVLPIDDATVTLLIIVGGGGCVIPFVFVEFARRGVDCVKTVPAIRQLLRVAGALFRMGLRNGQLS
jgi:hypothetical protein